MGKGPALASINPASPQDWERAWAPYDQPTYDQVLDLVAQDDIVLEIGAGDLRLSRQIAPRVRFIYALEREADLVQWQKTDLPDNCQLIVGDARYLSFPENTTTAVLLMRHCTQFHLYWQKLHAIACRKLITNARWGLAVEAIDLLGHRQPFTELTMGWYACCCGQTGFLPGPAAQLTPHLINTTREVKDCPACTG